MSTADGPDAMEQAMRWLARREYSIYELEQRLLGKGHPELEVADALSSLQEQGLVSDKRFAESLVRSRTERGYGPLKIAHELRAKGVDDRMTEGVLEADNEYWVARLHEVWEKRFGTPPQDYREWARQARGLQSRGFTAEQVRRVVPDVDA